MTKEENIIVLLDRCKRYLTHPDVKDILEECVMPVSALIKQIDHCIEELNGQ